ncbi:MAG: hypothetical protein NTZ13_04530 [Candidatus Parcubacteria bacterium]|nr:hypothetical protein [Candidatus Parcubacteria bacterium]
MFAFLFMMSIFSSKKPAIAIIFDIGNSSVGGAAVLLHPKNKPKLLHTVRKDMASQEKFDVDRFVSSMIETLEKVAQDISAVHLPPHSEKVFSCFLSSPWYVSQTRMIQKNFETPVKISSRMLEEIQRKEIGDFKALEIKEMGADAIVLETKIIQTKLNGYETSDPEGKEATDFQMAMYVSISPEKIVESITEKIKKIFHAHSLHFHSFPFSSFVVIRDLFHEKNFLFMDISGEVTDLTLVRDNTLRETVAFPLGKNFLMRKIANDTGSTLQESASQFRMSKNGELGEKSVGEVKTALETASKEWIDGFQNSLSAVLGKGELFFRDIFITSDNDVSKWFIENLQDVETNQLSVTGNAFTVRHLNSVFLSPFCESENTVERDSFLMIESIFVNRFV